MKTLITITLVFLINTGFAQTGIKDLIFDKEHFEAVDKWVASRRPDTDSTFNYGFIYIDEEAGFTYELGSTFTINKKGIFIPNPEDSVRGVKIRLEPKWKAIAIIPPEKLKELNLPEEPDWLHFYKENEGTPTYLKNIGFHYNHVGASHLALIPLRKAYNINPILDGLAFELSFALNAVENFEEARTVLEKAIENNPDNFYYYRELGYAVKNLGLIKQAEEIYLKGIEKSDNDFEKSEMAINMAQVFFHQKDREKFDEWAKLTRKYAEKGSTYAQYIDYFEAEWDKK